MLIIYCLFIGRGRLDWGARRSQAPGRKFYKRGTDVNCKRSKFNCWCDLIFISM